MRIEYHRTLIADRVRNDAFRRALAGVIRPGETTVADIGAGTGLLGLMAAKLGAREVYLYESAEVAGVAARVLKANRARNCHLFPCRSTEMEDPPRVDVVVSETLGNYALEEDIVATLADARRRMLAAGGIIIPRRIEQVVAPVVSARVHEELIAWDRVGCDLDLSPARLMSLNNIYVRTFAQREILESSRAAIVWDSIDLTRDGRSSRKGEAAWTLRRATTVFGFAYWWTAELIAGVTLSTGPAAPRTHWEQLYLPLLEPLAVRDGDRVSLSLRSRTSETQGTHIAWTALHRAADGRTLARQALDLDKGYLP